MKTLLNLWPYFKRHKANVAITLVFGALMSLCHGAIVPVGAYLFDRVFSQNAGGVHEKAFVYVDQLFASTIGNDPKVLVWGIPLAMILLYIINGISRYLHVFFMKYTADIVTTAIRRDLQKKYLNLNLTFHSTYEKGSGGLLSRTTNDVNIIHGSLGLVADLIREPLLVIILLSQLIIADWKLTLTIFAVAPILIIMLKQISRSLRKYGHKSQVVLEKMTSILKESLDGIKVIQSFNLEKKMLSRFDKTADDYLATRRSILSREEMVGPISEVLGVFVFAGMAFYFGNKVVSDNSSPGLFVNFVLAMGFMQQPIKKIQGTFIRIQQTIVSTDRIMGILNDSSEVSDVPSPVKFPENWQQIHFKDISFQYGDSAVLKNVDLKVSKGEVIALVGMSGSGKSTLVHLLERFFEPTQGEILFDDTSIKNIELKDLRRNVALVTQDVFLFNDSVENNIKFGQLEVDHAVDDSAKLANADTFIKEMPDGYKSSVGDRGGRLSGGEKQRISIARAIYKDAPILILDEATSALDSVSEIEVQKGIEKLMLGRTVFVIAHRLATIKKADRILVLSEGEIIESGTHNELLEKQGEYFNFHQLQMEGAEA